MDKKTEIDLILDDIFSGENKIKFKYDKNISCYRIINEDDIKAEILEKKKIGVVVGEYVEEKKKLTPMEQRLIDKENDRLEKKQRRIASLRGIIKKRIIQNADKNYILTDETFIGPNYVAVHNSKLHLF